MLHSPSGERQVGRGSSEVLLAQHAGVPADAAIAERPLFGRPVDDASVRIRAPPPVTAHRSHASVVESPLALWQHSTAQRSPCFATMMPLYKNAPRAFYRCHSGRGLWSTQIFKFLNSFEQFWTKVYLIRPLGFPTFGSGNRCDSLVAIGGGTLGCV